MALGCETNYFGHPELSQRARGLKTIEDAQFIASDCIQRASNSSEEPANYLIVGGGYTGFETAAAISRIYRNKTGLGGERLRKVASIRIMEIMSHVFPHSSPRVRKWAAELARENGLEIKTKTTVREVHDDGAALLSTGELVRGARVIWTAGVAPGPELWQMPVKKTKGDRILTNEFLQLPGHERVYFAGDSAGVIPAGSDRPLNMSVQAAVSEGRRAALNVLCALQGRRVGAYRPRQLGYVVPLMEGVALGNVLGLEVYGRIPFLLHYAISVLMAWDWRQQRAIASGFFRAATKKGAAKKAAFTDLFPDQ